jgi:hypothetical protein
LAPGASDEHARPLHGNREFIVHESVHHKNILIHIQQYAKLYSLFYLETALHVSVGTSTHHQERKQLYLQLPVFVTPLLLPGAIAAGSRNSKLAPRLAINIVNPEINNKITFNQ